MLTLRTVTMRLRPTRFRVGLHAIIFCSLLAGDVARADNDPPKEAKEDANPMASYPWQTEGVGKLGSRADVKIPEGFRFLGGPDASRLVEAMGNLTSRRELGLIGTGDLTWFVVFFFDDVGYVKDDEKDALDAGKMAQALTESLTASNEERRSRGIEELFFDGWAIPPQYNQQSKQLEWAQRLKSASGPTVNYNTRVLGRHGVVRTILVTDPDKLEQTLPEYRSMMGGFRFTEGEDYAAFRPGDKVAEYGLLALVAGGAGAVAAKTGLLGAIVVFFKKGLKLIVVGVLAAAAFIRKLFTGKKNSGPTA